MPETSIPAARLTTLNDAPVGVDGLYVVYWMTATRRTRWNFGLDRALEWCRVLRRPLLVLEALRIDYPWASERLHRFAIEGMLENRRAFERAGITCHTYVEPSVGAGRGLLEALTAAASLVVADEHPGFFLPRMVSTAARRVGVPFETVDSVGVLPLRDGDRLFATAASFRRHLQKVIWPHLSRTPTTEPLSAVAPVARGADLPATIAARWPALLSSATVESAMHGLPLDGSVTPVATIGGQQAAATRLHAFIDERIERYAADRNRVDQPAASGLSPYLHFGHISAHEIVSRVLDRAGLDRASAAPRATGGRAGWWGASEGIEAFLDQIITWRELGHNAAARDPLNYDRFEALPQWARSTLERHAGDPRPLVYSIEELDRAATHDPVWNAAQRELVSSGAMHNYLRMLWGKKILQWTSSPRVAFETMLALNDRYALDGRDPNSVAGIAWVLGRYDRPWGPERPIFGTIRYMSSESATRKLDLRGYLQRFGDP